MSQTLTSRRNRLTAPLAILGLVVGVAAVGVVAARAADPTPPFGITGSNFEVLDGNTAVNDDPNDNTSSSIDWDSLNKNSANALTATVKADQASGSGDNSFGNGSKEDTAVPSVIDGSIPPNKSDLKEFGSWTEKNANGQFLHLFWTRVQDPSGTTNMDFEFNKNACVVGGSNNVCSGNGVTPVRSNNDLLVTYDLSRGGSVATISLRRWVAASGAWGAAATLDPTVAVGSINGAGISSTLTGSSYSARTFGEASINLAAIFGSGCSSFGSAYLKSRSSDSFTSALKDFIAPVAVNVSNCGHLVVKKRAGSVSGDLLLGAEFTISPANNASPAVSQMSHVGAGSPPADTGVFCIDSLVYGTEYTIHESEWPENYQPGDDVTFTPNATSNSGSCSGVTTSTAADVTVVNQLQTASIAITKVDDAATPAPLTGATFTAYKDDAPASTVTRGAEDTVSAGSCSPTGTPATCTIASLPLGAYWVVETTTPAGYDTAAPQRVVLSVSGDTSNVSFTDPRQFKIITLVCRVSNNTLYPSTVTFNGGTNQTSLAPGVLSPADQAALCGLGGATKTVNKSAVGTPHTSTIAIN